MYPSYSAPGSQNNTLLLLILVGNRWRAQNCPDRLIKNRLQVPLRKRRALEILDTIDRRTSAISVKFFRIFKLLILPGTVVVGYWRRALLAEGFDRCWVVAEVDFRPYEDDRDVRGVVADFNCPLGSVSRGSRPFEEQN